MKVFDAYSNGGDIVELGEGTWMVSSSHFGNKSHLLHSMKSYCHVDIPGIPFQLQFIMKQESQHIAKIQYSPTDELNN